MKDLVKLSHWIEEHSAEIIENLAYESIEVYKFLKGEFSNSNVNTNHLFQFVFRSFYRLDNAGLTPEFKIKYFELLEQNRNTKRLDFKKVLLQLYNVPNRKGQNTIQFSFVTKMFNTINDTIPIYDNKVARIFSLPRPYQKGFDFKLKAYLNHFDTIEKAYHYIIKRNLLPKTIEFFDYKFEENELSEIKKLDFIFWSAGKSIISSNTAN